MEVIHIELNHETTLKIEKLAAERKVSVAALLDETVRILTSIADSDPVYDLAQTAARLNTNPRHVRALVRRTRQPLPYFKLGNKLRFRESDLQFWLENSASLPAKRAKARLVEVAA